MKNHEVPRVIDEIIKEIIGRFKDHPSIKIIKSHIPQDGQKFSSKLATDNSIKKIIDKLDTKTSNSFDSIHSKLVKLASKIISEPLSKLVNKTIVNEGFFSDAGKIACITPAFKKEDRLDKTNYRSISVLNVFSKVFKRFILDQLSSYFQNILPEFLSAYRKQYSCQHFLLKVIETWRKYFDENKIVGATLMNLSKAFDCLPHDLLVAKLEAYGLDTKARKRMLSYLSGRKQ